MRVGSPQASRNAQRVVTPMIAQPAELDASVSDSDQQASGGVIR